MICCFFFLICCFGEKTCDEFPKISVIVPVFNSQGWISVCINSLLNQTFKSVEIICVDDGSTDESLQILNEFAKKDRRVIVIHQNNCGVSCARNTGLKAATGEYVTFIDSDDWLELNAYEIAYEVAKENEVDMVVWGFRNEGTKKYHGPFEEKVYRGNDSVGFFLPLKRQRNSCVWNKMYLRSILRNNDVSFDQSVKYGEDFLFNIDVIPLVNSVYVMNKTLHHYNPSRSGLDLNHSFGDQNILAECILRHWENLKGNIRYEQIMHFSVNEITQYAEKLKRKRKKRKKKS